MGKCPDLFECGDLKAFHFLRLYFHIVIHKVQNKFVDIHKIVVFFPPDSPVYRKMRNRLQPDSHQFRSPRGSRGSLRPWNFLLR